MLLAASMLRTDSVPAPAASVTPLADHVPGARRRIDPGDAVGAHLDLLAGAQRAAVAAAHRLRRHAGDKVPGSAGVGTQRRHRCHRARPTLIVVEIQCIRRPAGIIGCIRRCRRKTVVGPSVQTDA